MIINEANQRLGLSSGGSRATSPVAPTTSTINTLNKSATPHTHVKNNTKTDNVVTDWNSFMSPAYTFPIPDGMTSGGGTPMFVSAKQVIPVRDGAAKVAKTDARDTALFAKNGGPFDKLFSGVLSRVNTIYEEVVDPMSVYGSTSNGNDSPSNISLNINGKLELTGENGQSINIIEELKRNPMFVRQITEMIVLQMNNNTHGGRNELFHNRFSG